MKKFRTDSEKIVIRVLIGIASIVIFIISLTAWLMHKADMGL